MYCKFTAIVIFALFSFDSSSAGWMRTKTTEAPPTPTVAELETSSSTTVQLETSSSAIISKRYVHPKKTQPTVAALETSSVLLESTPAQIRTDATTKLPEIETTTAGKILATSPIKELMSTMALESTTTELTKAPVLVAKGKKTRLPKVVPTLPAVDFVCTGKDDGYYPDSKDKCSSIYFSCVGGLARQMNCGAGDLVFEPESNSCERRFDSFRCTGTRKTTLPSTPRPPPQPTAVKVNIDCSKKDDDWYPDPQAKCSHTFYSCSNSIGSKFECPGNTYFDSEAKACLPFQDVEACAGKKPPTKAPKPTTPAPPAEKLPIDCSNKETGLYEDPTKKCSMIYYVCSNGDGFKRHCADGTFFEVSKKRCDYKDSVLACNGGRRKPMLTTVVTIAPKPSVASLLSTEFNCKGKEDKSYLPESKKCSHIYYRCVGGSAYKAKCPSDLYYDIDNDLCDRYMNLFVCSGKKPTSPQPTTMTPVPPVTEKLPIDCAKYPDGDFPDPQNKCSKIYYSCSGRVGLRRECPLTTIFDRDSGICDIRENVQACTGKPRRRTPKPTPASVILVTKSAYDCEKREDGNFPAGKCQAHYYSCVGGMTNNARCPKGTYYDTEMDHCGYKEEIPACGGVRKQTTKEY